MMMKQYVFIVLMLSFFVKCSNTQEFRVNTEQDGDQISPSIKAQLNGEYTISWYDTETKVQVFSTDGSKVGSEISLQTDDADDLDFSILASLNDQSDIILEKDSIEQINNLFKLLSQAFGETVTLSIGNSNDDPSKDPDSQVDPNLHGLSNGDSVLVWQSFERGEDEDGYGIFAQMYDSSGQIKGDEILVNTYTKGDQKNAYITSLSDGGFLVVWESATVDGLGYDIFGQIFDEDGTKVSAEFKVNDYDEEDQTEPFATGLVGGGYIVVWQSQVKDEDGHEIRAKIFSDQKGILYPDEFIVNEFVGGDQQHPVAAEVEQNRVAFVWQGKGQEDDSNSFGIYQRNMIIIETPAEVKAKGTLYVLIGIVAMFVITNLLFISRHFYSYNVLDAVLVDHVKLSKVKQWMKLIVASHYLSSGFIYTGVNLKKIPRLALFGVRIAALYTFVTLYVYESFVREEYDEDSFSENSYEFTAAFLLLPYVTVIPLMILLQTSFKIIKTNKSRKFLRVFPYLIVILSFGALFAGSFLAEAEYFTASQNRKRHILFSEVLIQDLFITVGLTFYLQSIVMYWKAKKLASSKGTQNRKTNSFFQDMFIQEAIVQFFSRKPELKPKSTKDLIVASSRSIDFKIHSEENVGVLLTTGVRNQMEQVIQEAPKQEEEENKKEIKKSEENHQHLASIEIGLSEDNQPKTINRVYQTPGAKEESPDENLAPISLAEQKNDEHQQSSLEEMVFEKPNPVDENQQEDDEDTSNMTIGQENLDQQKKVYVNSQNKLLSLRSMPKIQEFIDNVKSKEENESPLKKNSSHELPMESLEDIDADQSIDKNLSSYKTPGSHVKSAKFFDGANLQVRDSHKPEQE